MEGAAWPADHQEQHGDQCVAREPGGQGQNLPTSGEGTSSLRPEPRLSLEAPTSRFHKEENLPRLKFRADKKHKTKIAMLLQKGVKQVTG